MALIKTKFKRKFMTILVIKKRYLLEIIHTQKHGHTMMCFLRTRTHKTCKNSSKPGIRKIF